MKKLLISAFIAVAIVSFGSNMIAAHADTLTPDQTAALQGQIQALETQLAELELQAQAQNGTVVTVTPPPVQSVTTLSSEDIASLSNGLSLLASALTSIQTELAQNPQLVSGNEGAVIGTLQGIGQTLALIGNAVVGAPSSNFASAAPSRSTVTSGNGSVAVAQNEAKPAAETAPAQTAANAAPSVPSNQVTTPAAADAQTAQVSHWWKNINWPLTAVIVLIIAAVALWLFWPVEEEKKMAAARSASTTSSKKVEAPAPAMTSYAPAETSAGAPTPMAAAVAAPEQKPAASQSQHQRKPA